MASGISILGVQNLQFVPFNATRFFNLYIQTNPKRSRTDRLGTLIFAFNDGQNNFLVTDVVKLYGHGVALGNRPWWSTVPLTASVVWFEAGIPWTSASNA